MMSEAWKAMEEQASSIMAAKRAKQQIIDDKFKALHEYNIANPIAKPLEEQVVEGSDLTQETNEQIARESARWIGGYHAKLSQGVILKKKR